MYSTAWVTIGEVCVLHHLTARLLDDLAYQLNQDLLGLGITRQSLFKNLSLLNEYCIIDFKCYHTPHPHNALIGLPLTRQPNTELG